MTTKKLLREFIAVIGSLPRRRIITEAPGEFDDVHHEAGSRESPHQADWDDDRQMVRTGKETYNMLVSRFGLEAAQAFLDLVTREKGERGGHKISNKTFCELANVSINEVDYGDDEPISYEVENGRTGEAYMWNQLEHDWDQTGPALSQHH